MKQVGIFFSLCAITFTAGATGGGVQPLSPKGAASAFSVGRFIEQEAPQYTGLFHGWADKYRRDVVAKAQSIGGTNQAIPATIVPCDLGGEVEITGIPGLLYVLKADYRNCQSEESGLVERRSGSIEFALLNGLFATQRMVSAEFGRSGAPLLEERRLSFEPAEQFSVRLYLEFKTFGDFLERDASGSPQFGDYKVWIDGTFYEERDATNFANEKLLYTTTIVSDKVSVSGSARSITIDVDGELQPVSLTTTRYGSGVLTYDIYEQQSTPEFTRREWAFDDFKIVTTSNTISGEQTHSLNGTVRVNRPEAASPGCVEGTLKFSTPIRVAETGPDSQQFTSGLMTINGAAIRLSDRSPGAVIKSQGFAPVEFQDNTGFFTYGECYY